MSESFDGERRTTGPLSRAVIIQAAIAYVDAYGLQALSMRKLGQQLGVEAMSLYHYVTGREDLLEGIVEHLVDAVRVQPEDPIGPADGWQSYLQLLSRSVRSVALAHPLVFPLLATRHPAAPWLRPPLRSLAVVEDFLAAMSKRGLGPEQCVYAYKCFASFLLGHLLLEVAVAGAETGPVEEPLNESAASAPTSDEEVELADYPLVEQHRALLAEHRPDQEFEQALEALLDRLDLELSQ